MIADVAAVLAFEMELAVRVHVPAVLAGAELANIACLVALGGPLDHQCRVDAFLEEPWCPF